MYALPGILASSTYVQEVGRREKFLRSRRRRHDSEFIVAFTVLVYTHRRLSDNYNDADQSSE